MEDIAGVRFGRLVAVRPSDRISEDGTPFWVCYCDCGMCTAASLGALTAGGAVSCGCHRKLGRQYGWLTVTDIRRGRAECRCACGTVLSLPERDLGTKKSCGCEAGRRAFIDGQISLFPAENALAWSPVPADFT